jgi:hypothetical protein
MVASATLTFFAANAWAASATAWMQVDTPEMVPSGQASSGGLAYALSQHSSEIGRAWTNGVYVGFALRFPWSPRVPARPTKSFIIALAPGSAPPPSTSFLKTQGRALHPQFAIRKVLQLRSSI